MGRMPEASIANIKFSFHTGLSKTLYYKKNNPYAKNKVSIVSANHLVLKETKNVSSPSTRIVGSLRDREVAYSASGLLCLEGSVFSPSSGGSLGSI